MVVAFSTVTPGGASLCFFGSTAQVNPNGNTTSESSGAIVNFEGAEGASALCVCDAGWQWDFYLFHSPSCTMPVGLYQWFLLASALLTFGQCFVFFWIARNRTVKPVIKLTLGLTQLYLLTNFAMVVALFVQNGWQEAASVLTIPSNALLFYTGFNLVAILIKPAFSLRPDLFHIMKRRARMFFMFISLVLGICLIVLACWCRGDLAQYNTAALVYFICILCVVNLAVLLVLSASHQLLVTVQKLTATPQGQIASASEAIKRIKFIQFMAWSIAINVALFFPPFLIAFVVLGSPPFFWVPMMITQLGETITWGSLSIYLLTWHSTAKDLSSTSGKSPMIRQGSVAVSLSQHRRVLVMRPGDVSFSEVEVEPLRSQLASAEVIMDDGVQVSVLSEQQDHFYEFDTLLGRHSLSLAKQVHEIVEFVVERLVWRFQAAMAVFIVLCFVVYGFILGQVWSEYISLAFFVMILVIYPLFTVAFLNLKILRMVLLTPTFWIRTASATLSFICFAAALRDVRLLILFNVFVVQIFTALLDALSGVVQRARLLILLGLFFPIFTFVVMLGFGLIPLNDVIVPISSTFDYSAAQLARDLLFGAFIVVIFDIIFALRGAQRRFATLFRPVKFMLVRFSDDISASGQANIFRLFNAAPVSQLEVKSGFLMREASKQSENYDSTTPPVKVYVDCVCLKQSDSMAVHVFGIAAGRQVFEALCSRWAKVLTVFFSIGAVTSVFGAFYVPWLAWLAIPSPLFYVFREIATSSLTMLRLISKRRNFIVAWTFATLWFALAITTFWGPPVINFIFIYSMAMIELLRDANVRTRSQRYLVDTFSTGMLFFIVAVQLVFFPPSSAYHRYVDFRPDTMQTRMNASESGGLSYSDNVQVVDIYQQVVDLSIALGIGNVVSAVYKFFRVPMDELHSFKMPIAPVFDAKTSQVSPVF